MSEIAGIGRLVLDEGKVDEFKRLAAELMDVTRTKDIGTLQFEIYMNDDKTECVIYERYRDSDAVIEHGTHVAELMPSIFATGTVTSQFLLGEPTAELAAMTAGGGISLFRPFLSIREPSETTPDQGSSI